MPLLAAPAAGKRARRPRCAPAYRAQPELLGDAVGVFEADAEDILRQPIRVGGDHLDGPVAVGAVNFRRVGGADAVPLQEEHDVTYFMLLLPGLDDLRRLFVADAGHFGEPLRGSSR